MSSTFGANFSITTFGESHGEAVGVVVDGCPARLELNVEDIQVQLDRRRPGQTSLVTGRCESDQVAILSGVEDGLTLGTPIALLIRNEDVRPQDYAQLADVPRPSHADFTYQAKYGIRSATGGGRASARETVGRVAGGVVAQKWLAREFGCSVRAWVVSVGQEFSGPINSETVTREEVDASPVRCPDPQASARMVEAIDKARAAGDSLGGCVVCVCRQVPPGWGEPVFDKLEARLAQGMLSIPAAKGFEIGSGFAGSAMTGSRHNDLFVAKNDHLGTATNYSGGVQGGISNGEPIIFRVAFKPPASIALPQRTATYAGQETTLELAGRHDPCVVPRAVPIVEAMAALALADLALAQRSRGL